ncbi:MAG TPA: hypothetical protein VH137_04205 [Gemmatimonadales bacterium]|nr:hypothetical protein [Gemmatimonadales bacterium]
MKPVRSSLVGLVVATLAFACDPGPTAVSVPSLQASKFASTTSTKLPAVGSCPQPYDSVSQVIGPAGGQFQVGNHVLWVAPGALLTPVSITAVAPADTVRWVRFQPDGLLFQPVSGSPSAAVATSYKNCVLPAAATPRIVQVSDGLSILTLLQTYVVSRKIPWSQANQYAIGVLPHFSNYAVAW